MSLDFCKWDPQVQDTSTLAPFTVLMQASRWAELCRLAEALARETEAAERALLVRTDLHRVLAIPAPLRRALREVLSRNETPALVRVMRFDFHWTDTGWAISEVNSDVPGGFAEATELPRLMAQFHAGAKPADHPSGHWADAVAAMMPSADQTVALIAAPRYVEDQQVAVYLARCLAARGVRAALAAPEQLLWKDRRAFLRWSGGGSLLPLAGIVRFYQAEWLPARSRGDGWIHLLAGGRTPVTNPAAAIFSESKRLPLAWNALGIDLSAWRRLLPPSYDPRQVPWRNDDGWVLKSAFCNTGDAVAIRSLMSTREWAKVCWYVRLRPGRWIAQRRFQTLPLDTPMGKVYPCIGVFTVNGRASGAYVRLSSGPIVDFRAVDVAMLIEPDAAQSRGPIP